MLTVYACITQQHDRRLVLLAVLIAICGSYAALELLRHVRALPTAARRLWLVGAAVAFGSAVWATHFVAMLAFQPMADVGYDVLPTLLSLLVAMVMTGAGLGIAAVGRRWSALATSGAVIGLGTTVMHYIGMSAINLPGYLSWDRRFVAASLVLACLIGAGAVPVALATPSRWRRLVGAGLLTLSICAAHFIGMAAVKITLTGHRATAAAIMQPPVLAAAIAVACLLILSLCILAIRLDVQEMRRQARERTTIQNLADIAVEGLLVCNDDAIVAVNQSFEAMVGCRADSLVGGTLTALFEAHRCASASPAEAGVARDHFLRARGGECIPVELVRKPILYCGRPHQVVAVRDLRERRKAEEAIRFLAHHDALTGLANRTSFNAGLETQLLEQRRRGEPLALLAMDLDRFKDVNDSFGHGVGDALLKRVAGQLAAVTRKGDLVARLGGDEFAILAVAPISPADVAAMAGQIVEVIGRPYVLEGKVVNISASVGVAVAPDHGADMLMLMKNADLALYQAKADGRNTACFFEHGMNMKIQQRCTLEMDLRHAVLHDEMEVHYQPVFNVAAQRVTGFEALVRWRHPDRGLIFPNDFIPLAEETGLIVQIGAQVLRAAVEQAARWGGDTSVAVNLSAVQFKTGDLVATVRSALARSGLAATRLELEITESVLLNDGVATVETLHALREMGVRISMDDFGTGYSSLSYLQHFPFDNIKIDCSFVWEMLNNRQCAAIVWAVIGLAQRLGITTTAEGVETAEQIAYLSQQGCDLIQGYLIGRPQPAHETARVISFTLADAA